MGYLFGKAVGAIVGALGVIALVVLLPIMLIRRSKSKAGAAP
jgi:hypothetical protein